MPFGLPSKLASGSSSAGPKPFTVEFPSQFAIHMPNSLVAGTVLVDPAACRKDGITAVEAHVVCKQTSIYYRYYGGNSHDYRKQVCVLYDDATTVWTASADVADGAALAGQMEATSLADAQPDDDGSRLSKVLSRVSSKGKARAAPVDASLSSLGSPSSSSPSLALPFSFLLPPGPNQLPPTFETGTRSKAWYTEGMSDGTTGKTDGQNMGFTRWFVKVVGRREGLFKSNRKEILVFVYSPSATTPPTAIPPPLLPRSDGLAPERPGREQGWKTFGLVNAHREGLFKKKGLLVVQFAIPDLPSYPSPYEIPFHLTVLRLSPPLSSSSSSSTSKSAAALTPAALKLQLFRNVWIRARGASQDFDQAAVDDCVVSSSRQGWVSDARVYEESAWEGLKVAKDSKRRGSEGKGQDDKGEKEEDESENETVAASGSDVRRAGQEVVLTGSLRFPVGPSFERGTDPKGHLACSYLLKLALPLPSRFSSSTTLTLLPASSGLSISTCLAEGQGVPPADAVELDPDSAVGGLGLPGYFDVVAKGGDGWDDDDEKK